MENKAETNGKMWIIIGVSIVIIGILFTIAMSVVSAQNIDRLEKACIKDGGEPNVVEKGFIITTSYEFSCE